MILLEPVAIAQKDDISPPTPLPVEGLTKLHCLILPLQTSILFLSIIFGLALDGSLDCSTEVRELIDCLDFDPLSKITNVQFRKIGTWEFLVRILWVYLTSSMERSFHHTLLNWRTDKAVSLFSKPWLEDRLTNLESENKVLRQQAITMAQNNKLLAARSRSLMQRTESSTRHVDLRSASLNTRDHSEVEGRAQKALNDKQQENQDLLIRCIAQQLSFTKERPIAACIIYKCLRHWRSFEVERTSIFDRIIQTIGQAIEKAQDNNDTLAYWLSNTSFLLLLLQRTLKVSGAAGMAPQRRRSSAGLLRRMTQSFRGIPRNVDLGSIDGETNGGVDGLLSQIEAKYPALLFKQQLTAYVEKIYGMIRDNLKKEISPQLGLCIQVISYAVRHNQLFFLFNNRALPSILTLSRRDNTYLHLKWFMQAPRKVSSITLGSPAAQQTLFVHWKEIVQSLINYLKAMKANHVPSFLIRKVYTQVFSFINVQLFNSLLLRRECCSFSNAEYVKAGLAELENWCYDANEEFAGSAWDELKHIRQAIGFLVIHQKPQKTLDEVSHDLCPVLSIQQLYRISTMYWDDKYGTHSLSPEVISNMRVLMTEDSNNAVSSSFLLDDDSRIRDRNPCKKRAKGTSS
ncbi:hypothetical protein KSS87_023069 [Heliosperma pusillum]|nr:hypothetical protein KSS87_023069 [Heliosperma pusillum]